MTTRLDGNEISAYMSNGTWYGLLDIAREFGWRPKGTTAPFWWDEAPNPGGAVEWCGAYDSNDYQFVEPDDAAALGAALERSGLTRSEEEPLAKLVREIVQICRTGGFTIV